MKNVLIFPAGTEIGLEIYHSLKYCKEFNIFGAGENVTNHSRFLLKEYSLVPSVINGQWLDTLIDVCNSKQIDYIIPAHDAVIIALTREEKKIPASIITSPKYVCEITRSKTKTYEHLSGVVRTPKIYKKIRDVERYPVFIKPDEGQGSVGARRVDSFEELLLASKEKREIIVCEFLPGEEYTVDCFSDRDKGLLFAKARIRRRMRNGISVNSESVVIDGIEDFANAIGQKLELWGAWFFQIKKSSDGELALLEVAPRIAGSMSAHRMLGVNFPLLSIYEHDRVEVQLLVNDCSIELDRALSSKFKSDIFFNTLYIDLDDTLILHDRINVSAISLVFQSISKGIKVVLITRHEGDVNATLNKFRIDKLFDEIIHITDDECKSSYIKGPHAIFVDDSFRERLNVAKECGINTFDCSMLDVLLD